jgi:hypothetical protein
MLDKKLLRRFALEMVPINDAEKFCSALERTTDIPAQDLDVSFAGILEHIVNRPGGDASGFTGGIIIGLMMSRMIASGTFEPFLNRFQEFHRKERGENVQDFATEKARLKGKI